METAINAEQGRQKRIRQPLATWEMECASLAFVEHEHWRVGQWSLF